MCIMTKVYTVKPNKIKVSDGIKIASNTDMKKKKYYLIYSTLDWSAYITQDEDELEPWRGMWYGPFNTIKEARQLGLEKIRHDIKEFKAMRDDIMGKFK